MARYWAETRVGQKASSWAQRTVYSMVARTAESTVVQTAGTKARWMAETMVLQMAGTKAARTVPQKAWKMVPLTVTNLALHWAPS